MATYKDSIYKFTDPIRYFKENDPYYWEVDNIPLKQLQENVLWLKDQINPTPEDESVDFGVSRSDINELKPFVDGTGALVFVNPGRYNARINDAYNKNPLQKLVKLAGTPSVSSLSLFRTGAQDETVLFDFAQQTLTLFKSNITASALNTNGLMERILTWDFSLQDNLTASPTSLNNWPILKLAEHIKSFASNNITRRTQILSNEFVKQFRGVARTAIVDVPSALSIEVPPFDSRDFFYQNADGQTQYIENANVRIDLLFIYSKPIDEARTTIVKWQNTSPTTITVPQLGLIRGAGVGIRDILPNGNATRYLNATDADGNNQILAHVADQSVPTNGFQGLNIHGSFPSPDDLMNLAPQIQEKFETNDPRLIGQSILPIAYIVVRKNAAVTSDGSPILTSADLIDIRPFFRTTELAYNERAGICAAVPSISLANPVATQYTVEKKATEFFEFAEQRYQSKLDPVYFNGAKIAAVGYVFGGNEDGPERFVPPLDATIGWDLCLRARLFGSAAYYGNNMKYVDVGMMDPGNHLNGNYAWYRSGDNGRFGIPFIWRKTITVTGINVPFNDFDVNVDWHNCSLITGNGVVSESDEEDRVGAKFIGLHVLKQQKTSNSLTFTIIAMSALNFRGFDDRWSPSWGEFRNLTQNVGNVETSLKMFYTKNLVQETNIFNAAGAPAGEGLYEFTEQRISVYQPVFHPSVKYQVFISDSIVNSYNNEFGQSQIPSLV